MQKLLTVLVASATAATLACTAVAAPKPPQPPGPAPQIVYGTISVCNASGPRAVAGSFTYTLAAAAAAGGTQTIVLAVGACAPQIFYPSGTAVTITENVPVNDSVASITLNGGGATLSSSSTAAGSAVVAVGTSQALLTFTTNGPAPRNCKVPNVLGLGLAAAKTSLLRANCILGHVRRAYSRTFRIGHVLAEAPRRGMVLAPHAPVDLTLSRGPRP